MSQWRVRCGEQQTESDIGGVRGQLNFIGAARHRRSQSEQIRFQYLYITSGMSNAGARTKQTAAASLCMHPNCALALGVLLSSRFVCRGLALHAPQLCTRTWSSVVLSLCLPRPRSACTPTVHSHLEFCCPISISLCLPFAAALRSIVHSHLDYVFNWLSDSIAAGISNIIREILKYLCLCSLPVDLMFLPPSSDRATTLGLGQINATGVWFSLRSWRALEYFRLHGILTESIRFVCNVCRSCLCQLPNNVVPHAHRHNQAGQHTYYFQMKST